MQLQPNYIIDSNNDKIASFKTNKLNKVDHGN